MLGDKSHLFSHSTEFSAVIYLISKSSDFSFVVVPLIFVF